MTTIVNQPTAPTHPNIGQSVLPPAFPSDVINDKQAAVLWGVTNYWVRKRCREGIIRCRKDGNRYFMKRDAILTAKDN